MKLGSLFDGSGGFPLAGVIHGITPVWASEIEPYPIRVTKARFPAMKHLGDVTKIDGAAIEPVDIITFGSPCQDLSVAGKQAGLMDGTRSNLFFEAVRIIKEMREATHGTYPRIAVWENVPGAYSSNKGEDFRAVLQAFCSVKDETADVPRPAAGKWNPAGVIVGDGWSIAWRTFDAQFWGVPQRRKRIYLIADFGSERAGEILFEPESVRRDFEKSGAERQGTAGDVEGSVGRSVQCLNPFMPQTSRIYSADGVYPCLSANNTGGLNRQAVCCPIDLIRESRGAFEAYEEDADKAGVLKQCDSKGSQVVCYPIDSHQQDSRFKVCADGISPTLPGQMGTGGNNGPMVLETTKLPRKYIIRRLSPIECCRLQGFPDWWEDGVDGSDSARYRLWGNGIALPNASFVLGCAVQLIAGDGK